MEVTNRFKGLDLLDRVPEELWTEVHDILLEAGIKTITQKRNVKTQKKTLHMDITKWSITKSDCLQPKMEKLYTVSKNKTGI